MTQEGTARGTVGPGTASGGGGRTAGRPARVRSVDGLRALAFLAVFAFHSWEFSGRPEVTVVSGVVSTNVRPDFFVVLTGFVLYLPMAIDPERLGTFDSRAYFARRLRRIVLPYYAALLFAVLLPQTLVLTMKAVGRAASWQDLPGWGDVITHLTFTHLFFAEHWSSINGSLWTMSLEMQLYVLFPLIVLLVWRRGRRVLWFAGAASVLFLVAVRVLVEGPAFPDQFLWSASGLGRVIEFVAGVAAADVAFRLRPTFSAGRAAAAALVVGGSFWLATSPHTNGSVFPARGVFLSLMFATLILVTVSWGPAGRVASRWPLSGLGYRAYSMFLIHQPVAWYLSEGLKKLLGMEDGTRLLAVMWSIGLGVVLLVGNAFFVLVERPCISWAKRAPARGRAVPPARVSRSTPDLHERTARS
jgi:peptidoglycan/LPS O-acetylase OafA/YrhL